MKIKLFYVFLFFTFYSFSQTSQEEFSVLFYNVENLFDCADNPETNDNEFLPLGERYWTKTRLTEKLVNISKVILSSNGWNTPAIVALCEVENREVLEQLLAFTPLKNIPYKIIHKESPDHRGIDVALLYNADLIYPLSFNHFPLSNKEGVPETTREILYFSGLCNGVDTLHFFVNHWPSRYSGLMETRSERNEAAAVLTAKVKEVCSQFNKPKIIILGDFNDQPDDESIIYLLSELNDENKSDCNSFYNLSAGWKNKYDGTHKYQSQWTIFDQIIVSGNLLNARTGLYTSVDSAKVIQLPFLLEKDEKYGGTKPRRTYYGYSYQGGFSDHLPILLKLKNN